MDILLWLSPILIIWLIILIPLIDLLRNSFPSINDKLLWILIVLFLPVLGTILYYSIGRKQRIKNQ